MRVLVASTGWSGDSGRRRDRANRGPVWYEGTLRGGAGRDGGGREEM